MLCLDSLLAYSSGKFQALQLFVLVVSGAMDEALASYMLVHFGNLVWNDSGFVSYNIMENNFFIFFYCVAPQYDILNLFLTYFHVSNSVLVFAWCISTLILHSYSLNAFDWMGASLQIELSKSVIIKPQLYWLFLPMGGVQAWRQPTSPFRLLSMIGLYLPSWWTAANEPEGLFDQWAGQE